MTQVYTYNTHQWFEDGHAAGLGNEDREEAIDLARRLSERHPDRLVLVVRKPDNVIVFSSRIL